MSTLDTYRKQAKQLMRWHRESNPSVGGKVRPLDRFRHPDDARILAMPLKLTLAQEIVAVEAGFATWAARRHAGARAPAARAAEPREARIHGVAPILFVRDVAHAAAFYRDRLGFGIDFLPGQPPFYGSVSRGSACLHLRFVDAPNFATLAGTGCSLILASFEVTGVKPLFAELTGRRADSDRRACCSPNTRLHHSSITSAVAVPARCGRRCARAPTPRRPLPSPRPGARRGCSRS